MNRLRTKLESYQFQIRRTERERIKQNIRQSLIDSIAFDEIFEEFIAHKPHEVSDLFIETIKTTSSENVKKVNDCFHQYRVVYFQSEKNHAEDWFFDCTNKNNLKLVTFLEQNMENSTFVQGFYQQTIKAHQKYQETTYKFELEAHNSRCTIRPLKVSLNDMSQQSLLSIIYDNRNEEDFLATLQFWSVFLKRNEANLILNNIVMIKTFLLWYEHTDINNYKESYCFIAKMMGMIVQSRMFQPANSKRSSHFRTASQLLLDKVKRTIPYALNNLAFKQVGQTLICLLLLTPNIPSLAPDIQFRSQTVIAYLKRQFQLSEEVDNIGSIATAIRLVFYLIRYTVIINYSPLDDIKAIIQHLIRYLFCKQLQYYALLTLIELMDTNLVNIITGMLQGIDFQLLLKLNPNHEAFHYQFFNLILANCKGNKAIQDKILNQCDFIDKLIAFGQISQDYTVLIQQLIRILDSNISYFVDNWIQHVQKIVNYAQQIDFHGKQYFLRESQKYIDLKFQESRL